MSPIEGCIHDFTYVMEKLGVTQNTAALLVLAASVESASAFGKHKAENFGHELELALKNVLSEQQLRVDLGGAIVTEVVK